MSRSLFSRLLRRSLVYPLDDIGFLVLDADVVLDHQFCKHAAVDQNHPCGNTLSVCGGICGEAAGRDEDATVRLGTGPHKSSAASSNRYIKGRSADSASTDDQAPEPVNNWRSGVTLRLGIDHAPLLALDLLLARRYPPLCAVICPLPSRPELIPNGMICAWLGG